MGAAALALAACGARPSTGAQPASGAGSTATTATPATTAPATGAPTAAAGSGGAKPGRCHSAQLTAGVAGEGAATGHVGQVVSFRNSSSTTCTLYGYPGLLMLDARGQPLPTQVHRGSSYIVQPETPATVNLAPGGAASFTLGWADATGYSGTTCPASTRLEVTPPNSYRHLVVTDRLAPYGPCGRVSVSPVYPGTGPQPAGAAPGPTTTAP